MGVNRTSRENSQKLFKTSFMGFDKEDVYVYIDALTIEMSAKLEERDGEINKLRSDNTRLRDENNNLHAKQLEVDKEKVSIANTLLMAQETAKQLVDNARLEADSKKADFQRNYALEINKMATIRNEIIQLRKFATDAIRKFEHELSKLENETVKEI